jgi:predicted Zn finger-like uncharacterized protein
MLISCPKCRSIYEIPDNLIGKTGKNLRCQNCNNVWHAMVEDTLGYQKNKADKPYIEAIEVDEPPFRNYPSNKEVFSVPLDNPDNKVKPSTPSSFDVVNKEGGVVNVDSMIKPKHDNELTLTSDKGTSFTISMRDNYAEDNKNKKHFFDNSAELTATKQDRLTSNKGKKGYKFTYFMLFLLFICVASILLRREVVSFYPEAELYYNKVMLSGLNNPEYLKFQNVSVSEKNIDNKDMLVINANIYNDSFYTTNVPDVGIKGKNGTYKPKHTMLDKYGLTSIEIVIEAPKTNEAINLTLEFK